jgi:hypothetical protein
MKKIHWSTKSSNLCWQGYFSRKVYISLEDGAGGVQVGDIEQVIL